MGDERTPFDLSPALLRQRRNLMMTSLTILFLLIAGAQIDTVTVAGVEMSFKRPEAIIWFLNLFLLYFLYRYYLYLMQEPDFYSFKGLFYGRLQQLTCKKLQFIKNKLYPQAYEYGGDFNFNQMKMISFFKRKVRGVTGFDSYGTPTYDEFEINILNFSWEGLRACLYAIFNRSYITDYLLPFILAFVALTTESSDFLTHLVAIKSS